MNFSLRNVPGTNQQGTDVLQATEKRQYTSVFRGYISSSSKPPEEYLLQTKGASLFLKNAKMSA